MVEGSMNFKILGWLSSQIDQDHFYISYVQTSSVTKTKGFVGTSGCGMRIPFWVNRKIELAGFQPYKNIF